MAYPVRGRGAGVTGTIDLPGVNVKFAVDIGKYSARLQGTARPRRGRGGGIWKTIRWIMSSGSLVIHGKFKYEAQPIPDAWKGQAGTVTIQVAAGKTVAYPIIVTEHTLQFDKRSQDTQDIYILADVTALPTFSGFGTAPTATDPSKTDQQQWEGSNITYDTNGLATSAVRIIDWWSNSVADTDAAELAKLQALITAAESTPPADGLKVRPSTITRDAPDGGTVIINFGLTDTKDDIEMPNTVYSVDSGDKFIFGQVELARVQDDDTISWPTTPTEPADLKRGPVSKRQRHDGKWVLTYSFLRVTTEDRIEIDGTFTNTDPDGLGQTSRITYVTNSSTPPATPAAPNGQLVSSSTRPLTLANGSYTGFWVHTWDYGSTTRLQAIEFDADTIVDPSGINDSQPIPKVTSSSTPPATPTPTNTDLKLVSRRSRRIAGEPERWVHIFMFARNTAKDSLEHTRRNIDADNIGETESIPVLHTSATSSPSTPSQDGTAANLVNIDIARVCVGNGSFTGLWLWTYQFGPNTRKQAIQQDNSFTVDQLGLKDADTQTLTDTSSTPPAAPAARISGQIHVFTRIVRTQHTPAMYRFDYVYAYRSTAAALEAARTETTTDKGNLNSRAVTADVWTVISGAPADPTLAGFVLVDFTDVETDNPAYRLRIYRWGFRNSADELEARQTQTTTCVAALENSASTADVWLVSGGAPATPTLSGYVLIEHKDLETPNPAYRVRVYSWGLRDRAAALEASRTRTTVDVSSIDSSAMTADVWLVSGGAPATPTLVGYKLINYTDLETGNPAYRVRVYEWGMRTREDEIEFSGTVLSVDPIRSNDDRLTTVETIATTMAALRTSILATYRTNSQFAGAAIRQLTDGRAAATVLLRDDDKIVSERIRRSTEVFKAAGSGVLVAAVRPVDATWKRCLLNSITLAFSDGVLTLRRRLVAAKIEDVAYLNLINRLNNSAFLGKVARSLMYIGYDCVRDHRLENTSRQYFMDYHYAYRSIGWWDDQQVIVNRWLYTSGGVNSPGYTSAANFGWTVSGFAESDFNTSGFLT